MIGPTTPHAYSLYLQATNPVLRNRFLPSRETVLSVEKLPPHARRTIKKRLFPPNNKLYGHGPKAHTRWRHVLGVTVQVANAQWDVRGKWTEQRGQTNRGRLGGR